MIRLSLPLPLVILVLVPFVGCASRDAGDEEVDALRLRVMSYNIKHGLGMDGELDLERIATVIRRQNPDVLALQEVDFRCERSDWIDQATTLGDMTGMQAVFGPFMPFQGGHYGMAVLVRHPVVGSSNHELPPGAEPRTALEVRVQVGRAAIELVFVGIHLYASEEERLAQARELVALFADEPEPVLLVGDFNSERGSPVMELLEQTWSNPKKPGDPGTFPADDPEREIDFVLLRPAQRFEVRRVSVVAERVASDHRPVVVDVLVR